MQRKGQPRPQDLCHDFWRKREQGWGRDRWCMKTKNGFDQSALESISLKEIFFSHPSFPWRWSSRRFRGKSTRCIETTNSNLKSSFSWMSRSHQRQSVHLSWDRSPKKIHGWAENIMAMIKETNYLNVFQQKSTIRLITVLLKRWKRIFKRFLKMLILIVLMIIIINVIIIVISLIIILIIYNCY